MIATPKKLSYVLAVTLFACLSPTVCRANHGPLVERLDRINHEIDTIKDQIDDPNKKAFVGNAAARMRLDATSAAGMLPPKASKLSGTERTDFVNKYKDAVSVLIDKIDKLQEALKNGDSSGLKNNYQEIVKARRNVYHNFISDGGKD